MTGRSVIIDAIDCNRADLPIRRSVGRHGFAIGANVDQRVTDAISHWQPRFVANGVTAADFESITGSIERWEEWCVTWARAAAVHEDLGRAALASGRERSAGEHLAQAAVYYHFAKFVFVTDPEQMRLAHKEAVRCLTDALPHLDPPGTRVDIPFENAYLVGVLRLPAGDGPHPIVILIPGLDSAKEEFRSTEQLFLERGIATLSIDGPGQGESEYSLPIRPDWDVVGNELLDAVDTLPGVDSTRIGLWGVSLGGYYAPRMASGTDRVRGCIALAGPYDFGACWEQLPDLTRDTFRVRSKAADADDARTKALELTLEGRARNITCPLQVVMGKLDRLVPWQQAERLASEASGPVDFLLLEDGNHGCANVPYKHRYISADWMAEQLL
jgi:dipeptidyl aminopeptidase/acylaminoacyl peptidase